MRITCKKCQRDKPHDKTHFKWMVVGGKEYLEKTCKECRQKQATERANERYQKDESFRFAKLVSTDNCRKKNSLARNSAWLKRVKQTKAWRRANPDKVKIINARANQKRWASPKYRVHKCLSNRINSKIKDKDRSHCFDLVGYTLAELMGHIERLFLPGMTWENYGKWHIDHVIPVDSFSFESKNDPAFRACWALSNLQPLWAKDNIRKGNKVVDIQPQP